MTNTTYQMKDVTCPESNCEVATHKKTRNKRVMEGPIKEYWPWPLNRFFRVDVYHCTNCGNCRRLYWGFLSSAPVELQTPQAERVNYAVKQLIVAICKLLLVALGLYLLFFNLRIIIYLIIGYMHISIIIKGSNIVPGIIIATPSLTAIILIEAFDISTAKAITYCFLGLIPFIFHLMFYEFQREPWSKDDPRKRKKVLIDTVYRLFVCCAWVHILYLHLFFGPEIVSWARPYATFFTILLSSVFVFAMTTFESITNVFGYH